MYIKFVKYFIHKDAIRCEDLRWKSKRNFLYVWKVLVGKILFEKWDKNSLQFLNLRFDYNLLLLFRSFWIYWRFDVFEGQIYAIQKFPLKLIFKFSIKFVRLQHSNKKYPLNLSSKIAFKEVQIKFSNLNFPLQNRIQKKISLQHAVIVSWGTQSSEHSFLVFHSEYERWENGKEKKIKVRKKAIKI